MEPSPEIMEEAKLLSESWIMIGSLFFEIFICIVGGVLQVLLLFKLKSMLMVHKNCFLLIFIFVLESLILSVFTALSNMKALLHFLGATYDDPLYLVYPGSECILFRIPQAFGMFGVSFSNLIFTIERLCATVFSSTYNDCSIIFGVTLGAIQIVLPMAIVAYFVADYDMNYGQPYCALTTKQNRYHVNMCMILILLLEIVVILTNYILLHINRRRRRDVRSVHLNQSYQNHENYRMIQLFLPLVWVCFGFTSFVAATLVINISTDLFAFVHPLIYQEVVNILYLYSIVLPFLFYFKYRNQSMQRGKIVNRNIELIRKHEAQKNYFRMYKWR